MKRPEKSSSWQDLRLKGTTPSLGPKPKNGARFELELARVTQRAILANITMCCWKKKAAMLPQVAQLPFK